MRHAPSLARCAQVSIPMDRILERMAKRKYLIFFLFEVVSYILILLYTLRGYKIES